MAAEAKAMKAAEKQAQWELKEAAKRDRQKQLRLQKEATETIEAKKSRKKMAKEPILPIVEEEVEEVVIATSEGKHVQRPKRFQQ